jgi:hypothetical protein
MVMVMMRDDGDACDGVTRGDDARDDDACDDDDDGGIPV